MDTINWKKEIVEMLPLEHATLEVHNILFKFVDKLLSTIEDRCDEMKREGDCDSEECKIPSFPICRHKMGYNDALEDFKQFIKELK